MTEKINQELINNIEEKYLLNPPPTGVDVA